VNEPTFRLPPRRVGVAVKVGSADAVRLGREVVRELGRRGVAAVVEAESAAALDSPAGPPRSGLGREVDLVLVLGGDGTFLSATRGCPSSTPVAGVNLGTLGFLTEHAPENTFTLLEAILRGEVRIEPRQRLLVRIGEPVAEPLAVALNDVVVNKGVLARIVTICVEVEGEFLSRYRADGLIIATPTGSTGYNLSAGGPIVHPAMGALLVTPICAHDLTNRPLVVPTSLAVAAWVESWGEPASVTVDGQLGVALEPGVRVHVSSSPEPLSVVRDPAGSFFSVLHRKLKWGEREG